MSLATNETWLYLDGALATGPQSSNSNNTGNFGNLTLKIMTGFAFSAGRFAEMAIYPGEVLNASEAMALARGVSPRRIRPSSNPYYWPILGKDSPEPIYRSSGPALTVTGAVLTNHPPVIPFSPRLSVPLIEEAAPGGGVTRQYMYYQRLRAA